MKTECIDFKDPDKSDVDVYSIKFVKAAIRVGDKVYLNWRHHLIIWSMHELGFKNTDTSYQGFVDQNGYYYGNRLFCGYWAWRNGQINKRVRELFSEDLWDIDGNKTLDTVSPCI